ncbi:hypothetical protein P2318_12725 [Myxococcaceae bacterium GXIMD 01537]
MPRRTSALLLASWLLAPGLSMADDEFDPEKLARIRREEEAELAKVDKAHDNKKLSEMDNAERRQVIEEKQAASAGVLEKNGMSAKDYARQTARMGPEGNKAVDAAMQRQAAEEKARADAEAKKQAEQQQEVTIQHGLAEPGAEGVAGGGGEAPMDGASIFGGGDKPPKEEQQEEQKPARKKKRGKRGSED